MPQIPAPQVHQTACVCCSTSSHSCWNDMNGMWNVWCWSTGHIPYSKSSIQVRSNKWLRPWISLTFRMVGSALYSTSFLPDPWMYVHPLKNRSWSSSRLRWQWNTLAAAKVAAGLLGHGGRLYSCRTMGISHEDGTHKWIPSFSALHSCGTLENQHGKCCETKFENPNWSCTCIY